LVPEFRRVLMHPWPCSIREFDRRITAPMNGYSSEDEYYRQASAAAVLAGIAVPTVVLSAADDPLVTPDIIRGGDWSPAVSVHVTQHGGHLGFVGVRNRDPDRRWMDWRIVQWVQQLVMDPPAGAPS
jgi:predicted alpha/beta-fold hydrolase